MILHSRQNLRDTGRPSYAEAVSQLSHVNIVQAPERTSPPPHNNVVDVYCFRIFHGNGNNEVNIMTRQR